jgi:UDP-glucose 4-epimerase
MSIDDAVDLVLYAYTHAQQGDTFVQKSPAATVGDLAQAIKELFNADNKTKIIGTWHGEKLYETLLTREEMAHAQDLGDYYRIPSDNRDLNYNKYFIEGQEELSEAEDYNSHNTERLNVGQIKEKLLTLQLVRDELAEWEERD